MNNYDALDAVTKWIKESSHEEFMKNFNTLEGQYSGITIGEYLDNHGTLDYITHIQFLYNPNNHQLVYFKE